MARTTVIYHGNCMDGFTAAWAVRRALGDDGVTYVPGFYGQEPPDVSDQHVIMVDFSYKRPVLDRMFEQARSIVVLDHHVTAKDELEHLNRFTLQHEYDAIAHWPRPFLAHFDMAKSGARLAWEFFHKDAAVPAMVQYVEDRDLWRFTLGGSREINAWLFSWEYGFDQWDDLEHELASADGRLRACNAGEAILRKQDKDVAELLGVMKRHMVIGGARVPVANLPYTLASEAAGKLAEGQPFAACYFDRSDGKRVFSLRSRPPLGEDVSEVAKHYGGGGHRNAAGFERPLGWEGDDRG